MSDFDWDRKVLGVEGDFIKVIVVLEVDRSFLLCYHETYMRCLTCTVCECNWHAEARVYLYQSFNVRALDDA